MPKSATDIRHFIIAGVLVAIGTAVIYWLLDAVLLLPTAASTQAFIIDNVVNLHLILIAFLFSLVVVFMLYSMVAFRRRDGDDSDGVHFEGNTVLEIAWTVVPLIVVVVFGYIGIVSLNDVTRAAPNEVEIEVEGFQWSWAFTYNGEVVSPELVLPVDRQARMKMTSRDVIHSFWIPEMRVKQDLVPGKVTELVFTPTELGEYSLRCSELCGLSHYSMVSPVRVVEQAEYDAWLAEETAGILPSDTQPTMAESTKAEEFTQSASN
jgi:cytochrome c oxidase subunit 2